MKRDKLLEYEKQLFLSLCSQKDRDKLSGKSVMTLQDFERISYIVHAMELQQYDAYLVKMFSNQSRQEKEKIERENEIFEEYPEYYQDEAIFQTYEQWLIDFCNQLPTKKLQEKYREKFDL